MAMNTSFTIGIIAISMLLHAAYSTIQYRTLLKITEDEFTGPPYEVILYLFVLVELMLVMVLSLFAGLTVPGNFRSILPDSDENR
ncbi:hypothetical protein HanLR1_Chr02g0066701 [Helianthus annuus]|nr:hypothetical protein HanLR1_Chr02g0066701 [Helianthus annuus]